MLEQYKQDFIDAAIKGNVLKFGEFTLKSLRQSPYFFNAGNFYHADVLEPLATAFAQTIIDNQQGTATSSSEASNQIPEFDVVFGPAYKGIPLAAITTLKLYQLEPSRYGSIGYSFDRKEVKTHGEGGQIVGAPLSGKKVLIVDDVLTAGTAKREAIEKIVAYGGQIVAIVIALDRAEKLISPDGDDTQPMPSALGQLSRQYNVPIVPIISFDDLLVGVEQHVTPEQLQRMKDYQLKYKPTEGN